MNYNCLKCALIAIYEAWTTIYILLVFHSSGESVLNKNYKINKSLNFNTVLCVNTYRNNYGKPLVRFYRKTKADVADVA